MKFRLYYRVVNNGDGSASVQFFDSRRAAEKEEEDPEEWGESTVGSVTLAAAEGGLSLVRPVYDKVAKKFERVLVPLTPEHD